MQISIWVPYDETRLLRTIRYLLRAQINTFRVVGGVFVVLGLVVFTVGNSPAMAVGFILLGLLFGFAFGPFTVAQTLKAQADVVKDGHHMIFDDEWLTTIHPLAESRLRWAGFGSVVETADVWYIRFGKVQAFTVPKDVMTEEQRATFGAFVNGLQPVGK